MAEFGERELGWDDEIEKDSTVFEPLPGGDYPFTIESIERSRSRGEGKLPACNMAIVTFTVHGKDRDVNVKDRFILHTSLEWKLSQLFRSVGMKKEGEKVRMNWNALPGSNGRLKLTLEKNSPNSKNPEGMHNEIKELYPFVAPKYKAGTF